MQERENFWKKLPRPFFCLAPMADVTDPAFRALIAKKGKPDVMWTEFVSADGLMHPLGKASLLNDLMYSEQERPIIAQLFTKNPTHMKSVVHLCIELGFDGVDINMGCPDRAIEKQGCGSAMIQCPQDAVAVIQAAQDAIRESGKNISLSVKTRVGYTHDEIDTWIRTLLEQNLDALTVHARTRKDLSRVPANWDYITRVVVLRNQIAPQTVIIGNGDVADRSDGIEKARSTGCDGIMIGRACFGNPWIFRDDVDIVQRGNWRQSFWLRLLPARWAKKWLGDQRYTVSGVPVRTRLQTLVEHAHLFSTLLPDKSFSIMKKHIKAYVHGFPSAVEFRTRLMQTSSFQSLADEVNLFLDKYHDADWIDKT